MTWPQGLIATMFAINIVLAVARGASIKDHGVSVATILLSLMWHAGLALVLSAGGFW